MLSKNAAWSLAGGAIPALAALVSTPYMISVLDFKLFAITSLILTVTIFFYVYDLGMSRTMTFLVSKSKPNEQGADMGLIGSALASTLLLALLVTTVLYFAVPFFVRTWMKIDANLLEEAIFAFQISVLSVTPGLVSNTLKGVLEGQSKFKEANICKIISGASIFLAPMIVIAFISKSLIDISLAIVLSRYISLVLYALYTIPASEFFSLTIKRKHIDAIWVYAVWAAISGFISTTFVYGDRFVVAGYLNPQDLSIYIASQDILIRYLLIPWSMAIVLMPVFAANRLDKNEIVGLYRSQQKRVGLTSFVLLSLALLTGLFAVSTLDSSIVPENVEYVVSIQIVGIFFCALSQLPLIYLFGRGAPKLITTIFLVELVIYVLIAPFIFRYFGLIGACLVWSGRLVMEYFLLRHFAKRLMQ